MKSKKDARRLAIQRVAAELFTTRGYDVVSVRELADAAGISQPTLYRYIGSKQQLLASIYESMQNENLDRFTAVAELDAPADEKLRMLFRQGFQQQVERATEATVYYRERHRVDADYMSTQIPVRRQIDDIVRRILADGVEQGLWPESHSRVARMMLWGAIRFLKEWFRPDGPTSVDEMADLFADIVLNGLRHPDEQRNRIREVLRPITLRGENVATPPVNVAKAARTRRAKP